MTIIIIVDDSSSMRAIIKMALAKLPGAVVVEAVHGRDALAKIQVHPPQVIITDLVMPEMDGITFIKAVREKWTREQLPIFILSAKNEEDDVKLGLSAGANDYFTKPLDTVRLVEVVGRYVARG